jgi:hypothetical protein
LGDNSVLNRIQLNRYGCDTLFPLTRKSAAFHFTVALKFKTKNIKKTCRGCTPLHYAALVDDPGIVNALLEVSDTVSH